MIPSNRDTNFTPKLIINSQANSFNSLSYTVSNLDLRRNIYNYIIIYKINNQYLEEIARLPITSNGEYTISDKSILDKLTYNSKLFSRIESYSVQDGSIVKVGESTNSNFVYTPKEYTLEILEDNKNVYTNKIVDVKSVNNNQLKISFSELKKYDVDKYYTYNDSTILVDGNKKNIIDNTLLLNYFDNKITVNLKKQEDNWSQVNIVYPDIFKDSNSSFTVKNNSTIKDLLSNIGNYQDIARRYNSENYTFLDYFIDDKSIASYAGAINNATKITAKYNTKITIESEIKTESIYMKTGDKLSNIDFSSHNQKHYNIVGYKIIDNSTKSEKDVSSLDDMVVENSITIKPIYKVKTKKLMLRQDDYNKRFGLVSSELENKDIDVPENQPINKVLENLKSQISPKEGYELQYRINRKPVTEDTFITEDIVVEIYFKKIEEDWVSIKFVGVGIDKFLSDGQDVYAGKKINSINLPTSQENNKDFLGWLANIDYNIEINNKIIKKDKDSILKTIDLQNVITEKRKNLIFTAVYVKHYDITIDTDGNGTLELINNNSSNVFTVKQDYSIKNTLINKKLLLFPKSHYNFSHLTSTLPVLVDNGNGEVKIINKGERINLQDFYNIVPKQNLTFKVHFKFYNGILDLENIKEYEEDIFGTNDNNYNSSIESVLGPLYFLR
ncbi:hypothetical protein HZY83_05775 [Gemella sp. GH3]|uniref:hypothetical protein n=1 Tax=unclassified Gemella TaxID=2624949 RepID=UPI0015D029FA|nr:MULTISPECIES: hypothetical protein [unclassified Gemella]MBF0714179.1 hypothetical protein [Gemella sp. GH3.1]NYS51131.1 hypothetical protein [Gemella sp. GH3]